MCGILACIGNANAFTDKAAALLQHRGVDFSNTVRVGDMAVLTHHRLAIVDPTSGSQPFVSGSGSCLAVNGEIYNHQELKQEHSYLPAFNTQSDCEILLHFLDDGRHGYEYYLNILRGMFAFVYANQNSGEYVIARDPLGIIPLYYAQKDGNIWVASELKALHTAGCGDIQQFPAGYYMSQNMSRPESYVCKLYPSINEQHRHSTALFDMLEGAVVSHLMSDVPYAVLLSGGLDSSIIASLVVKHAQSQVHTFSIGLKDSPDLQAAREVADHLGTTHHEIHFKVEEGIRALERVIYYIETYDVTTVRASTPMYLLSKYVSSMNFKMVLSGEGADELFGGYLYFHAAPNAQEFKNEVIRKVQALHHYDLIRANKSMMAHSVECRVPFLDTRFVKYALRLDPEELMHPHDIEKKLLRDAFSHMLPRSIIERRKEQFSDGVGYGWIDALKDHAASMDMSEQQVYESIFTNHFGEDAKSAVVTGPSIACSTPVALKWLADWADRADPSGRAVVERHAEYASKT